jgi:hypothetical protein
MEKNPTTEFLMGLKAAQKDDQTKASSGVILGKAYNRGLHPTVMPSVTVGAIIISPLPIYII